MSERVHVPVELLRRASELLLAHLESVEGDEVLLDKDFYWAIAPEHLHNPYAEPSAFTLGQLSECAGHLERLVDDPEGATSYALVWLADLLRATGQVVVR